MQEYEISLDMRKSRAAIERTVVVRRGDNNSQRIEAAITAGGAPYEPAGRARLDIMHADGSWARCAASASGSTVGCTLPPEALNGAGRCRAAHFVFTDGDKVESTEGFALVIEGNVDANGSEAAKGYEDELEAAKAAWLELSEAARRDEAARGLAESARAEAEASRAESESGRAAAERARAEAEAARAAAEAGRKAAEAGRAAAEEGRAAAEGARDGAEASRSGAESARERSERAREAAERERAAAQARNDADQAANNAASQGLQVVILAAGQYDPATLKPTVAGEVGKLYFVPDAKRGDGNLFREWMSIDGSWEQVGMSTAAITGLTTDQIDTVAGGGSVASESVLNGTALTYLWSKIGGAFAAASHGHAASDIASGTIDAARLPVLDMGKVRGLEAELADTSRKGHAHAVADVAGLRSELDSKQPRGSYAASVHAHAQSDVDGLDAALADKATKAEVEEVRKGALAFEADSAVTDLNKLVNIGIYSVNNASNRPSGVSGWVNVIVIPVNGGAGYTSQLLITMDGYAHVRAQKGGSWTSWKQL